MDTLVKQCNRCREMFEYERTPGFPGPTYCSMCIALNLREARERWRIRLNEKRRMRRSNDKDAGEFHGKTIQAPSTDS